MTQTTPAAITTNTDTTIVAAPGAGQILRVSQIAIGVAVVGTTASITFEDGTSGDALFSYLATAGGTVVKFDPVLELSENTLLNALTAGGAAATWHLTIHHEG